MRPHTKEETSYQPMAVLKAGGVLVAIAAYILVSHSLGFLITGSLITLALMLMLEVRLWHALPASLAVTIMSLLLFDRVLRVPLPLGILGL